MADDTRQPKEDLSKEALTVNPDQKAFTGSQWKDAGPSYKPPENANMMPGGTQHTAGGQQADVTLGDAAKSIKWDDWTKFPKKPCVRDSLMTGIGTGFAMGAGRAILRAPVWTACNWAVGSAVFASFGMYQYCNWQRQAEKEGMKRAMEIIDRKQVERKQKEARLERAKELRRQKKEQEQDQHFAQLHAEKSGGDSSGKPWWKVW